MSAALVVILALATTKASSTFILLMAYTLGLGIPFLLVGLFTEQAQRLIKKSPKWIKYLQIIFGILLY